MIPIEYAVGATLFVLLFCALVIGWQRYHSRQLLNRLNQMLEAAMQGTFTEHSFDETMISALESKFADYLSSAETSATHLKTEKDKIKELIADISHQTKTPIANILLYAQLLQEQTISEDSKSCVEALQGQADKLNFLIASLVKLSRLETGILIMHPILQPVRPILQEIEMQYQPKAEAKGITLIVEDTTEQAIFDAKWTAEAVGNVVDNAIKYTSTGGNVKVCVQVYELFLRLDIADNGVGISEEEQAKIFARFYRSPKMAEIEGVGIGLYLTRQILLEQGGYIKVSSEPNRGTVFSVFLQR